MIEYHKNPRNQIKLVKNLKGFSKKEKFLTTMSPKEFDSFLDHNARSMTPKLLFTELRYSYEYGFVRAGRETLKDEVNETFGTNYKRKETVSDNTAKFATAGLSKTVQGLIKYNSFTTNFTLMASNLLDRRYLVVLRKYIPYTPELELMIDKETIWSAHLKLAIAARKERLHQKRTLIYPKVIIYSNTDYQSSENNHYNVPECHNGVPIWHPHEHGDANRRLSFTEFDELLAPTRASFQKQRSLMSIPKHIHDIQSINLTDAGKISLSPFSKKVIGIVDAKTAAKKPTGDPFRYFVKLCSLISKELGENPQWALVTQLSLELKVSPNDPKLLNTDVNEIPTKGKAGGAKQAAWRPASSDPYYRTPEQIAVFEESRAKREAEWEVMSREEPERLARIEKRAQEFRENFAIPFLGIYYKGNAQPATEQQQAELYTHDVPYIQEDGPWEEI